MRTLTIFKNNLKTVSRNWLYFLILIVCPFILITLSGIMLNSAKFENVKVGMVNLNKNNSLIGFDFFKDSYYYSSLKDCIRDISSSKISICIQQEEIEEKYIINVYIDNRKSVLEYYVKQFILKKFAEQKISFFEESLKEINKQITLFSYSIKNYKTELNNTYYELDLQERKLIEYKENITNIKQNIQEIYSLLKRIEPTIQKINETDNNSSSFSEKLESFKEKKDHLENNLVTLKEYLKPPRLQESEYNYIKIIIDENLNNLNQMGNDLDNLNKTYSNISSKYFVNLYYKNLQNIEQMNALMNSLENELNTSIIKTKETKTKIRGFILTLEEKEKELNKLTNKTEKKDTLLEFKDTFQYSSDIVTFYFPLLVAIIVTFTSLILSNTFIIKQTQQNSYLREILTPTRSFSFFIASYFTSLFFIFLQTLTILLIGYYLFDLAFFENLKMFLLIIFICSSIFIFIGMIFGYAVRNQNLSILFSILVLILCVTFSDLLTPTSLTGPIVRFFVNLNPFTTLYTLIFDILLIKSEFDVLAVHLKRLSALFFLSFIIAYIAKKISIKKVLKETA